MQTVSNSPLYKAKVRLLEQAKQLNPITNSDLLDVIVNAMEVMDAADFLLHRVSHVAKALGYEGEVEDFQGAFEYLMRNREKALVVDRQYQLIKNKSKLERLLRETLEIVSGGEDAN
ncbi:hypothetical protein AVU33_gp65 [Enterobacteria phage JenP2]|uniref:Uncharacterized protein n=1 Tax=Enterobacteria phage JenP2 TaxID=1610838 RepID=A0A0E3JIY7_9CAUD|nr:hypothetical protein AVU33_gp65 [Enterobacteria phage JenP2]AKA61018.1 hypothetical protein [Enterobacteria phage JenP2]